MLPKGNQKISQSEESYRKNQIHITRHLIQDTLDINWSSVLMILHNCKITLPTLVIVPLMEKYKIRSNMDSNDLISYITPLTGVTWQTPPNSI